MKRHVGMFVFVLFTMVIQLFLIGKFGDSHLSFSFLDGVPVVSSYPIEYQLLLYWYLPVSALSFYFSGFFSDMIESYAKVVIVRNYSKTKWAVKRYCKFSGILLFFVLFQFLLSSVNVRISISVQTFFQLALYFLTLLTLFGAQLLFELYLSSKTAQLFVNLYIVLSVLLTQHFFFIRPPQFVYYFLLPNYGMAFNTGHSHISLFQKHLINGSVGCLVIVVLQVILLILIVKRMQKMDLF